MKQRFTGCFGYSMCRCAVLVLGFALVLPFLLKAQPDNDLFVHRQPLLGEVLDFTANLLDATLEAGEPDPAEPWGSIRQSVWYQWTAPENGWARIRVVSGSGGAVDASVYTGETVDSLTLVKSSSQGSTGYFPVLAGWDYQIAVYPNLYTGLAGYVEAELDLQFQLPPSNDNFAQRILLDGADLSVAGSLVGATREVNEPVLEPDPPQQTVWWSWTAPATGTAVVTFRDLDGFVAGYRSAAFTGDAPGQLTLLASNSLVGDLPLNFQVQAGQTYQLMVGSWYPDLLDGFIMDLVLSSWHLTSPEEAVRLPAPAQVTVRWESPPPDTTLRNVQAIAPQGFLGWWPELLPEGFTLANLPAGDYSVQLMALDERNRTYVTPARNFSVVLENDNFANRTSLSGSSFEATGVFQGATIEPDEPGDEPSVWWSWVPPFSGRAVLFIDFGARFDLFTGDSLATLQPIPAVVETMDRVVFDVTDGLSIQIRAGAKWDGSSPSFRLDLFSPPANDNFAGRVSITTNHLNTVIPIALASIEAGEPPSLAGPDLATVWFSWTASAEGLLGFGGGASDGFYGFAVFTGNSLDSLETVAEPSFGVTGPLFSPVAGTTYQIAVIGHSSNPGDLTFLLDFLPLPPNDLFTKAQVITGPEGQVSGNNDLALTEPGEPVHFFNESERSVWYSWTAPESGFLQVFATTDPPPGYSFDPAVTIYRGPDLASLEKLGSGIATSIQPVYADVEAGVTYHFVVAGTAYSPTSDFQLHWKLVDRPANDAFADRILLTGTRTSVPAVSLGATRETDEPLHGGRSRGRSVWWTWTAPYSGWVTFSAFSEDPVPAQLWAYEGSSLQTLTLVGDSNSVGDSNLVSPELNLATAIFEVTAGQTYQLVLDTLETLPGPAFGAGGSFDLELDLSTLRFSSPTNDAVFSASDQVLFAINTPLTEVDGQLKEVDFRSFSLNGPPLGESLGVTSVLPFSITRTNLPPARYFIMALATNTVDDLRVTLPVIFTVRPENDDFAGRLSFTDRTHFEMGSLAGADREPGEPAHSENINAPTVWYSWTAPAEGEATFDILESAGLLRVYVGDALDQLVPVTESSSSTMFHATRGQRYEIVVEASDELALSPGYTNSFTLHVQLQTTQLVRPEWYERVAPGMPLVIEATTTEQPEDLQGLEFLVDGEQVGTVTSAPYRFEWASSVPGLYQIGVRPRFPSGQSGVESSVFIIVTPANDAFAARQTVSGAIALLEGTTQGATIEAGEPANSEGSIWYTWRAPATGLLTFDGAWNSYWPQLLIFSGAELGSLTLLADNSGQPTATPFTLWVEAGQDYNFAVGMRDGQAGPVEFNLTLQQSPPNDGFENRALLQDASGEVSGTLRLATAQAGEPNHEGNIYPQRTVWWTWTATTTGTLRITTLPLPETPVLFAAYTGVTLETLATVPTVHVGANVDLDVQAGITYHFAFDDSYGGIGDFFWQFRILSAPVNDAFANRIPLTGRRISFTAPLFGATREAMEPNHHDLPAAGSAWWSWTAPASGQARIQVSAFGFSPLIGVYRGTILSQLTEVASGETVLDFEVVSGIEYLIAVDGSSGSGGDIQFQLTLDYPPPNDQFSNRILLAGTDPAVQGWNILATREYEEAWHADQYGGRSVWYAWLAPVSGTVTLDLTSDFWPSLLAVYHGSGAENLVPVASAEGWFTKLELGFHGKNQLQFPVELGKEYAIAIAGAFGSVGDFTLEFQLFGCVIKTGEEGQVHLTLIGLGRSEAEIQTSTNLTDWTHVAYSPGGSATFEIDVMIDRNAPIRFYRGVLPTP